ncbi:hypothetical protein MHO82_13035 [Vibrio sp. Of7-15]|uniref:hypothetical protein n=1 Tax=Vibrio sp. Of7-15 TaxID=2724879 RepID=UPI001EF39E9E|nr:hypothetical protein [Vibrio sp. Of7-15]MCG7497789.1 hypothetical protein [Vibrio sp. Of7-15]
MWATLDFESSGLSKQSYPIEVGFSLPDGRVESVLINPNTSADLWTYWDDVAENEIHHISRAELIEDGMSVIQVCQTLNQVLAHYDYVLCDSQWDLFWLGRLYHAAHMRPSFLLLEVKHWLKGEGIGKDVFVKALEAQGPIKHRAGQDAKQIRMAIKTLVS